MAVNLREVASEFSLSEESLTRESLRAFLLEQLRLLDAERQARCAKFGVTSLSELDELVQKGAVSEETVLDDFQNIDYLTTRIERVKAMLEEI